MPVHKPRNASGRLHQHNRTTSGGSSKIGLNLQLTQKEPVLQQTQLKRAGHSAVELHPARNTSPYPRINHGHYNTNQRVQSKERLAALQQKRAQTPLSAKRQPAGQHKAEFSLSRSDGTDEDEWVSSESGAATPQNVEDEAHGGMLIDHQRTGPPVAVVEHHVNGTTPRAEPELSRIDTARPTVLSQSQPPIVHVQPQSTPTHSPPSPLPHVEPPDAQLIRHTRSEAPSPTRFRQKQLKRPTLTRNSSVQGEHRPEMPPHPLIRGQSYHTSLKPAPLAPLAVHSEAAQVQLSASPPSSRDRHLSGSPTSMVRSLTLQSPNEDLSEGHSRQPGRKSSISSLHSIATLPAPSSARIAGSRNRQDRTRTLSTISTSSSSAALTSLNMLPAMSRPGTPPMNVHFPSESRRDPQDGYHQLLPPPYFASHATMAAKYNPLHDCYERVIRAKQGR